MGWPSSLVLSSGYPTLMVLNPCTFNGLSSSHKPPPTTRILGSTIFVTHQQSSTRKDTIWDNCHVASLVLLYPLYYQYAKIHGNSRGGGGGVTLTPFGGHVGLRHHHLGLLYKRNPPARHFTSQLKLTKKKAGYPRIGPPPFIT